MDGRKDGRKAKERWKEGRKEGRKVDRKEGRNLKVAEEPRLDADDIAAAELQ